ncbi:hypothetical protein Bint_0080 [Brachyspira intermedia PWS/A]|uniref:Uncharacterized protein n=1 Tax=Brachyspira intermedia (strain ATCC 51140 / PWS/A) TaxID=1045858 RepID=G0EPK2_BRAIP|nr:hypothetical protein [Brachyspira intermedia]AEM20716.1 hypothetical protein Bint_0080 [Brachyspira intermedia PWS/A]
MLYKDKNGSYTSDYLLDGEFTREMDNNFKKSKKPSADSCETIGDQYEACSDKYEKVFDNYNLDNEDRDFYACTPAVWGDNCQNKDDDCPPVAIDNFVDKLFSNDPFEESSLDLENEEYEGFDPTTVASAHLACRLWREKLDKDNPFIQYEMEDNKVIADLNELREITKNTFEKFKNKIIK